MLYFNLAVSCLSLAIIIACVFLRHALPRAIAQLGNLEEKEAHVLELKQQSIDLLERIDRTHYERLQLEAELGRLDRVHDQRAAEVENALRRQIEYVFELGMPEIGETPYAMRVSRGERTEGPRRPPGHPTEDFWCRPHKLVAWARNRRIAVQMVEARFKRADGYEIEDYVEPPVDLLTVDIAPLLPNAGRTEPPAPGSPETVAA
jgi:hypothetical protein